MNNYKKILLKETQYAIVKGQSIIKIPTDILLSIKEVSSLLNKYLNAFYFGNELTPMLLKGTTLYLQNGYELCINTIEDIETFINSGGSLTINDRLRLDKDNYDDLKGLILDTDVDVIYLPLLHSMVKYIESYYLITEHPENDIILGDIFNITNDICLTNTLALDNECFIDTYNDFYMDDQTKNSIMDAYMRLYNFFIESIDIFDRDMFRLSIGNTYIVIERLHSPSAIRYSLNSKFLHEEKVDKLSDDYIPDNNDLAIINKGMRKDEDDENDWSS